MNNFDDIEDEVYDDIDFVSEKKSSYASISIDTKNNLKDKIWNDEELQQNVPKKYLKRILDIIDTCF